MSLFFKSVGCECPGCSSSPCDPPDVPASTFYKRTASASKTKCGYAEFTSPSSPPKRYLTSTLAGTGTRVAYLVSSDFVGGCPAPGSPTPNCDACVGGDDNCKQKFVCSISGSCTVSRPECVTTNTTNYNRKEYFPCDTLAADENESVTCPAGFCTGLSQDLCSLFGSPSYTNTVATIFIDDPCDTRAVKVNCNFTATLSIEYTTADLISDVDAAIPAFSGVFSTGSGTAFYDLSTDELTATKRALEYKFELPALVALGYTTYRLDWVERFTPEGGSPTDTAKFYNWDGSATETGVYTVSAPSTQGTTSIVNVVASCL